MTHPTEDNFKVVLEKDIFLTPVMDEVCLFPLPKTKYQRILELNNLTSIIERGSPREV